MSTEEPTWKAEAASDIADALKAAAYECDGDCGLSEDECWDAHPVNWFATAGGVTLVHGRVAALADVATKTLESHIQAAERRGREAGLREAAVKVRDGACVFDIAKTIRVAQQGPFAVIAYAQLLIADAIDPDRT